MASRYTKRDREQAAAILSACASMRATAGCTLGARFTGWMLGTTKTAYDLARHAFLAAEPDSNGLHDPPWERWAEAEAMIREGWEP